MYAKRMGDLKSCDIHDREPPANILSGNSMYEIYVQKVDFVQNGGQKKKYTTSLYTNGGLKEGIDACTKCMTESIIRRLQGINQDFTWKKSHWQMVKQADGTEKLTQVFDEIPASPTPLSK